VSTEATTDVPAMLERLQRDGIEHLWVVYHDYSGRAMAKTVPRASFETALTEGVVFALANLNMDIVDHQPPRATLLANTGDFLAVPDPRSYAVVPVAPKTARMYAWMRATDGSVWEGCPRTRLDKVVAELAQAGFSVQCAFEPEFYLLNKGPDGEYHPVNPTRMMTRDGLAAEINLVQRIMHDLELMGRRIPQFGKEYGPGQYEVSTYHGPPIKAVDDYLTLKDVIRDAARTSGYVASFMPKIYADWAGSSLHVHLSLWDAAGEDGPDPLQRGQHLALRPGALVHGWAAAARSGTDRARLPDRQQLQAAAARLLGAGQPLLGLRQPLGGDPHPWRRHAAAHRVPLR